MLFGGYREIVEIVEIVGFVGFGGYRETVEIVDSVGSVAFAGYAPEGAKKDGCLSASVFWSEQRDLNPRPPSPEPGALPAALCPENTAAFAAAVWLGMRESNSHK